MVNNVTLIGGIGKKELKNVGSSQVMKISLATTKNYKKNDEWHSDTQWHNLEAWGDSATYLDRCEKGDRLYVEGELIYDKWKDKDGNSRTTTKIRVKTFKNLGRKNSNADSTASNPAKSAGSDDLPF